MSNYVIINGELCNADDELYHYGVPGMKWGVRRATRKIARLENRNAKMTKAMAKYDVKSAKRSYKLAKKGLDTGLTPNKKSAKYKLQSAKLEKKATKLDPDSSKALRVKRKAAKKALKSIKAMKVDALDKKEFNATYNSAKLKYKIANNKTKIDSLNQRVVDLGKSIVEDDNG